jgi:CBS-domain-containing membrane protein
MLNKIKENFKRAIRFNIYQLLLLGSLSLFKFKTTMGLFLVGSFGSSMVLLFGYPESPFAQPKNIFFGHFLTH